MTTSARREGGSGTVLTVAAIGVLLILTAGSLQIGAAATAAHRARTAADLSALAGATALQQSTGSPCARVAEVAGRNGARLLACTVGAAESVSVRVATTVPTHWPGVPHQAVASARAGPADTRRARS